MVAEQLDSRYNHRLLRAVFSAWTAVQFARQEKRAKRFCLVKVIQGVDSSTLLSKAFSGLRQATTEERACNQVK